jgi:hypothetical protein
VWMEGIIERSKERAGVHSHLVTDAVPADPNQIQLPKFVGHRCDGQGIDFSWDGMGGNDGACWALHWKLWGLLTAVEMLCCKCTSP